MKPFKFFQKPVKGDLTMFDGQTYITASHNMFTQGSPGIGSTMDIPPLHEWDTPQGHNGRRRLYHTNREEYERQRHQYTFQRLRNTNDDMERYFIENGFRDLNDNPVEPPLVTKPKLKWYQRFLNEDNKLILLVLSFLGGIGLFITAFVYYYTQR